MTVWAVAIRFDSTSIRSFRYAIKHPKEDFLFSGFVGSWLRGLNLAIDFVKVPFHLLLLR